MAVMMQPRAKVDFSYFMLEYSRNRTQPEPKEVIGFAVLGDPDSPRLRVVLARTDFADVIASVDQSREVHTTGLVLTYLATALAVSAEPRDRITILAEKLRIARTPLQIASPERGPLCSNPTAVISQMADQYLGSGRWAFVLPGRSSKETSILQSGRFRSTHAILRLASNGL